MIGIIIGIAVGAIFFFLTRKWDKELASKDDTFHPRLWANWTFSILLGLLAFSLGDALFCGIFNTFALTSTNTTEKVASVELVALQDNSATTGQFFLGSGSANNKTYYAFYYETPNGYKYETLDAKSSTRPIYIKYAASDTETPRIDRYAIVKRSVYTATVDPLWFSCFAKLSYPDAKTGEVVSTEILSPAISSAGNDYYDNFRYEIIIPQGSIIQDYKIDLE